MRGDMTAAEFLAAQAKPKRAKYGNKKTRARDGRTYDSKKEAAYADKLMADKLAGGIEGYVPQVSIPCGEAEGGKPVRYIVDFMVSMPGGRIRWVDVKGRDTPNSRTKRAALRQHGVDVELV